MSNDPHLLVDLSNICRDESVIQEGKRADWNAYERLMDAIREAGIRYSGVTVIADRNLIHKLDTHGKSEFRRLEREGSLEVSELADRPLIEYAFNPDSAVFGAIVASQDRFADFRRTYPEIQGCNDRFIGWRVGRDGILRAFFRDMGVAGHATMSRKEEGGELKARRIRRDDVRRRAEDKFYTCENPACLVGALWPDHLREIPFYDDRHDNFVCPGCRSRLKTIGPRPPAIQLIVFADGQEQSRILLQRGESLVIGRSDAEGCIGLRRLVPSSDPSAISRRHVEVSWRERDLQVHDLGSKNGTAMRNKRSGAVTQLGAEPTVFTRQHSLVLAGSVTLELSGRRASYEGERPLDDPPPDAADVTRLAQ